MNDDAEEFIPTRRSLLSRLKNWEDQESWRVFFDTYWKLIYGVALKAGLTAAEAEDVVQETVLTAAKTMGKFKYDPKVCSFKSWLMHLTRIRIADQFHKRMPTVASKRRPVDDPSKTSTLERVPDPGGLELEPLWNAEWSRNLLDATLDRVKRQTNPKHDQLYYLHVIKSPPARDVAQTLNTSVGQVYLARHRISRQVRKEVQNSLKVYVGQVPMRKMNSSLCPLRFLRLLLFSEQKATKRTKKSGKWIDHLPRSESFVFLRSEVKRLEANLI
ncbi:MAG: sigma-70 family RNA polymerase sigma factor [Verrucomicrobia bacterium]|nr:sigma-70 family RNA polymerase sigma factor [Verrucomicrobiota bacterium]